MPLIRLPLAFIVGMLISRPFRTACFSPSHRLLGLNRSPAPTGRKGSDDWQFLLHVTGQSFRKGALQPNFYRYSKLSQRLFSTAAAASDDYTSSDLVKAPYAPAGDQPEAIDQLCRQLDDGDQVSILRGITGTGKTLVMAHVLAHGRRPTLVLCHNKTLAAQLARELKSFLKVPVELFVSYYNHYVPESFVETTGKYIAKKSSINQEIDILRHRATRALLKTDGGGDDGVVVVVASVSCIYGLGLPKDYLDASWDVRVGERGSWDSVVESLQGLLFDQVDNDDDFIRGSYQLEETTDPGDGEAVERTISLWPPHEKYPCQIRLVKSDEPLSERKEDDEPHWVIESLREGSVTGMDEVQHMCVFPARHHATSMVRVEEACLAIEEELEEQLALFRKERKFLEADRLQQRVLQDVMMMRETGFCSGGENYSRHLAGRGPGEAPNTLLDYMSMFGTRDWLLMVDESHVTLPQLKAMYHGDQARKRRLVKHGYRLPSALDNRPLQESEFWERVQQTVMVSATPAPREVAEAERPPVEMVIRPTYVCDPEIEVRPTQGQLDDLLDELSQLTDEGRQERALIVTLTKRDSEDLSNYLNEHGVRSTYIHSGMTTNERSDALKALQVGDVDCLVGINCLREGLDLPQVSLVAVLNADVEGFLRSQTALLQVVGRAARNINGKAIFYANRVTAAMKGCIDDTHRRREKQLDYNNKNERQMRSTKGSSTFSIFDLLKDEIEAAEPLEIVGDRARKSPKSGTSRSIPMKTSSDRPNIDVEHIPSSPGVYFWKDSSGNVLYIGKANKLRSRVKSYLSPNAKHTSRIKTMLSKATSVDIILSPSQRDALLLESNLIKHHQPPFNILLKDDEHYPYICATLGDSLPKFSIVPRCPDTESTSEAHTKQHRYFGPYTSFSEINGILQGLEERYDLRAKSFEVRHGSGSKEEYLQEFNTALEEVFSSKSGEEHESQLKQRRMDYEEANLLFESKFNEYRDVVALVAGKASTAVVLVVQLRSGIVANSFSYSCNLPCGLESPEDRAAAIQTVLGRKHYPSGRESSDPRFTWFPNEILLSEDVVDKKELEAAIKNSRTQVESRKRKMPRVTTASSRGPKKDVDARALKFALENAEQVAYEQSLRDTSGAALTSVDGTAAAELADMLSLPAAPSRIECYDISHTQGEYPVGSRVVFIDGKPVPHLYRKFNIRPSDGVDSRDDYSSIHQVLSRRFKRASKDAADEWAMPDLVVIDGGPGQLGAAVKGISGVDSSHPEPVNVPVPVCSLAKSEEALFVFGQPNQVNEKPDSPALLLLRAMRDESHRFALSSHRKRRSVTRNRLPRQQ